MCVTVVVAGKGGAGSAASKGRILFNRVITGKNRPVRKCEKHAKILGIKKVNYFTFILNLVKKRFNTQ